MAEELRNLRLACTNATQQEQELLRVKRDLDEARRQITELQVRVVQRSSVHVERSQTGRKL